MASHHGLRALSYVTLASLALAACAETLPSPPATLGHHLSPASLGEGETTLAANVEGGGSVFGPGLVAAEVSARHGVGERLDVGARLTAAVLLGDQYANPPHRGVYAARLFLHHETVRRILALHAGAGGGGSAAGGYVAADVGFTVGYENAYVVPFLSGQFFASAPVTKNTLVLVRADDPTPLPRVPFTGFGPIVSGGLRIPLGARGSPFGWLSVGMDYVLLVGNAPAKSGGVDSQYGFVTGFVGYEHRLGSRGTEAHRHDPLTAPPSGRTRHD
ncbi:MAG: hypothetical protein U0230_10830 [Polyangiales bacterium]